MLNAVGYVTKQDGGCYKGHKRIAIIKAQIYILPNMQNAANSITDSRAMAQSIKIGAGWICNGEASGRTM
jgi:uncharacterized protein (DUF736 family)